MRLEQQDAAALLRAMDASFDTFSLDRVVTERLGVPLGRITSQLLPLESQTLAVHQYYQNRNEIESLVAALRDSRPKVPEFVRLGDLVGLSLVPSRQHLEVFAQKDRSPFKDVVKFRTELAAREASVCRVETATGTGTGALLGPDVVLTAHHVIADAMEDGNLNGAVTCEFDVKEVTAHPVLGGVKVAATSVLAWRNHAKADLEPNGDNQQPDRLDYALLKLERAVGAEPIVTQGDKRGYLTPATRAPELNDGLLVLQHPKGVPMKIDIGAVIWVGKTRVRHSVNTDEGSSGSPVFDAELNIVAMHHAGHDWPDTKYPHNQAVPLSLILKDAAQQGATLQ